GLGFGLQPLRPLRLRHARSGSPPKIRIKIVAEMAYRESLNEIHVGERPVETRDLQQRVVPDLPYRQVVGRHAYKSLDSQEVRTRAREGYRAVAGVTALRPAVFRIGQLEPEAAFPLLHL